MSTNKFKDLTLDELAAMKADLEGAMNAALQQKRREALKQIQSIVQEFNLSYEDVVAVIRTTTVRGKAPAIYRNPDNPRQTWSGKGEAPAWFVTASDKDALLIPGAVPT